MKTRLSLAMTSLMEGVGDFSLDFEIGPEEGPRMIDEGPPVFELAELDSLPRPLVRLRPIYPSRARQQGIEGFVELAFVVAVDGKVDDVSVVRSDPGDIFVAAALAAVRRWRFAPGQKEGKAVATRVRQVIRFRLEDR
jgi:protein TonB